MHHFSYLKDFSHIALQINNQVRVMMSVLLINNLCKALIYFSKYLHLTLHITSKQVFIIESEGESRMEIVFYSLNIKQVPNLCTGLDSISTFQIFIYPYYLTL